MNLSVRAKILGGSAALLTFLAIVGAVAVADLGSVKDKAAQARSEGMVPSGHLANLNAALLDKARAATYGVVFAGQADAQAKVDTQIAAADKTIAASLAAYKESSLSSEQRATLADLETAMAAYQAAVDPIRADSRAGNGPKAAAALQAAADLRAKVMADVNSLIAIADQKITQLNDDIGSTFQMALIMILGLMAAALVIGTVISLVISRAISRTARDVRDQMGTIQDAMGDFTQCIEGLADNDLTREYRSHVSYMEHVSKDELGEIASGLNSLLGQLKTMVGAYEKSRLNLVSVIGEVTSAAESVSRTSSELDNASVQTGTATQQIASTITQVATGASDQARAASETSASAQELTAMIAEVSSGASETDKRVEQASRAIQATSSAVARADRAGDEMRSYAGRVHSALENGIQAVDQTADGMRRIKSAVEATAAKVTELGAKSDQIGAIVETIDDIAEQTNLLALNAAIEAARAGEQGKGFAVVADEVRKLAERSSRATKEIAALISEVQAETERAVLAMKDGATEVQQGSVLADRSATALEEIKTAAAERDRALSEVFSALVDIGTATGQVVAASDAIAAIAAQTNTAAANMTTAAATVSGSMESIAAVSEENSAAAEEVSAATEEMSAQAEEVVASAASLAEMARQLDELVARFKLQAGSAAGRGPTPAVRARQARGSSEFEAKAA